MPARPKPRARFCSAPRTFGPSNAGKTCPRTPRAPTRAGWTGVGGASRSTFARRGPASPNPVAASETSWRQPAAPVARRIGCSSPHVEAQQSLVTRARRRRPRVPSGRSADDPRGRRYTRTTSLDSAGDMRKRPCAAGLLLLIGVSSGDVLLACGDKFLVSSRGTRFQRAAVAREPASILIYTNPASELPKVLPASPSTLR